MDLYTKAVLTVIFIGIGLLVFQERPLRDAQAESFTGNDALARQGETNNVYHARNGRVRICYKRNIYEVTCGPWSD